MWLGLALAALTTCAYSGGPGTSSGLLLREDPSARVLAMGGLAYSPEEDVGATFVNPATLANRTNRSIGLSYWPGFAGVGSYQFAGAIQPLANGGAVNLSYLGFDSGDEEIFDLDGTSRIVNLESDQLIVGGVGKFVTEHIALGLNAKFFRSQLAGAYSAQSFAGDFSALYRTREDRVSLGFGVQNVGSGLRYRNVSDPLPLVVRSGGAYTTYFERGGSLSLAAEVLRERDQDAFDQSVGTEWGSHYSKMPYHVRGGIRRRAGDWCYEFGLGLSYRNIGIDWGLEHGNPMYGAVNRISLSIQFGDSGPYARALAFDGTGLRQKAEGIWRDIPQGHPDYVKAQDAIGVPVPTDIRKLYDKPNATPSGPPTKLWLLSVGISTFSDSHYHGLHFSTKDAVDVADLFRSQSGNGLYSVVNTEVLIDQAATLEAVLGSFPRFLSNAGPDDVVIVYLSTHGDRSGEKTYVVAYNTRHAELERSALPMSRVEELILKHVVSDKVVVIADTCYAGGIGQRTFNFRSLYKKRKAAIVLASSRTYEESQEDRGSSQGLFTFHLLEGLRGAARANQDSVVTAEEAFVYLVPKVVGNTHIDQHPTLRGFGFDLPLVEPSR